jgi:phosphatidylinositol alpha-mannosyltransferase
MRVGLVCPYSWDIPGGVQAHVRDLAEALIDLGHEVSLLTPADEDTPLPPYAVSAGRAVPVRYNGSVARLQFGPVSAARARRWLRDGRFDVLHLHEPSTLSLSLTVLMLARGPIVATWHSSITRSRTLSALGPLAQPFLERISGRIAVSAAARRVQVEHLGGDAVEIPNGVAIAHYAGAEPLPGYPRPGTVGFVGRYDEPRKGMPVLLDGLARLAPDRPELRLLVAGRGDADDLLSELPPALAGRVELLGQISEADKARMLRSVDVYCAPNLLGESFGVILIEALAAGAPIVASDLDAFKRVLEDGAAGVLVRRGDAAALGHALCDLLDDPGRRAELSARGAEVAAGYDWTVLARRILAVYETVVLPGGPPVGADDDPVGELPTGGRRALSSLLRWGDG